MTKQRRKRLTKSPTRSLSTEKYVDIISLIFRIVMRQRTSYPKPFKAQVVQKCLQPGVSMASVALRHGINANLARK